MSVDARLGRRSVRGALSALLISLAALLLALTDATAQGQLVDPPGVSLKPADLPRGFSVVERQTAFEPLRSGQNPADANVVGVSFRTVMERPRTLENLQSGPVRVGQVIARSDDPARATFSLDAQREYNVREHGYEVAESTAPADEILCLVRRDGPFIEYRIVAVKNADTLVSTTAIGLPSAVNLDGATALMKVSLARYDEQATEVLAAQPPPAAAAAGLDADFRAVATATPTPAPPAATAQPTPTPGTTPTVPPTVKVKLPSQFDDRLAQPWSELMNSTATTKSGERMGAFLRRVIEESHVEVTIGILRPNVGGELRSVANVDGDKAKIIESAITINKDVMGESPRVLAAMLAHEITHAGQPIMRSEGKLPDCVEAEVEAYAVQARVWSAFWGQAHRPGQTKWERSMNYVEEVWKDSGEDGLRHLIRQETGTDTHSCVG
jgi:hypothetical protein